MHESSWKRNLRKNEKRFRINGINNKCMKWRGTFVSFVFQGWYLNTAMTLFNPDIIVKMAHFRLRQKRFALPNGSKIFKMFSFSQRILAFWGLAVLIIGTVLYSFKWKLDWRKSSRWTLGWNSCWDYLGAACCPG